MAKFFDRRSRVAPSHYPRIPFHGLRLIQLISSLVVGSIMCYFIWHLTHDHWSTPWTFIWLTAASLFSVVALAVTIFLHCFIGLNPRLNLVINGVLLILWALSWSLLTWYMSATLANVCDVEHWHEDVGIMICRIYKALFSFTLLGFLSTLGAFILDIFVRRQQTARGIYRLHDIDTKHPEATRGPFTDPGSSYAQGGLAAPRESEAWDAAPRLSMGPYGEREDEKPGQPSNGYSVPANQFEDDTAYNGHNAAEKR